MEKKNNLPLGWEHVKLSEIAIINPSKPNTVSDDLDVSFIPMKCVEELTGQIDLNIIKKYHEVKKGFTSFLNGDIIFAKITPCMENGKIAVVNNLKNGVGFGSTEFHVIRMRDQEISKKLYFWYLLQDNFRTNARQKMKGTAGQLRVPSDYLKEFIIPLPPLNEQKRIVVKIEELFSLLDANMFLLQKITFNLNSYMHSFLKDTFEGKLTALWREQNNPSSVLDVIRTKLNESKNKKKINSVDETFLPSLPDKWAWVNFEIISSNNANAIKAGPFGSSLKKEFYVSSGYKIYGQEQVIRNDPEYGNYYIDAKRFEMLRSCEVKPDDLLISLVGTIGKTLVLPTKIKSGIINPRLIKITLDKDLSYSKYIQIYFESQNAKNFFKLSSHGGTMAILNMNILKKLPIPLPPLKEQFEIIKKYELELSLVEDVKLQIQQITKKILMLKNVILKQSFEGKLVPQDPNDEPASELLKRIKLQK